MTAGTIGLARSCPVQVEDSKGIRESVNECLCLKKNASISLNEQSVFKRLHFFRTKQQKDPISSFTPTGCDQSDASV